MHSVIYIMFSLNLIWGNSKVNEDCGIFYKTLGLDSLKICCQRQKIFDTILIERLKNGVFDWSSIGFWTAQKYQTLGSATEVNLNVCCIFFLILLNQHKTSCPPLPLRNLSQDLLVTSNWPNLVAYFSLYFPFLPSSLYDSFWHCRTFLSWPPWACFAFLVLFVRYLYSQ